MVENTSIEWADHTFNPWEGCQKVGPGCDNCYAETRNARFAPKGTTDAPNWGPGAPRRRTSVANWQKPLAWNALAGVTGIRPRVFCASLADVFDNAVDPSWRADLAELIGATPNLRWLLLTKRIGNASKMLHEIFPGGTPGNIGLGATVVNQKEADRDIPELRRVDVAMRFLSIEPMLGPIDLSTGAFYHPCARAYGTTMDPSTGQFECCSDCDWTGVGDEIAIHWVIAGGESGPGARPSHPDWYRSLRDQCEAASVPFLFKQWGEWSPDRGALPLFGKGSPEIGCAWPDGTVEGGSMHQHGGPGVPLYRVGKKLAGRLLDGVQHDGAPA